MSAAPQLRTVPVRRPSAIRPAGAPRVYIGHALVDNCSFEQAQSAILSHAAAGAEPAYVITPNAQHIVLLNTDTRLREICRHADLVVPDGISLLFAARVFGRPLSERVTGVDLFQSLCAAAASSNLKVFFLGGLPGSADLAADRLRDRFPGLDVQTYCPPLGFEHNTAELAHVAAAIRAAEPSILFVGLGAPKQEYWIYDHGRTLGVRVLMGIGGSFEMVSGIVRRAPHWVQASGCEWLYRLCMEPKRLWRRYLIGNSQFLQIVLNQRITRFLVNLLVHILKSSPFDAQMHDAKICADIVDILGRVVPAPRIEAE
jgi:N-acetylglucosaminyldiphosphoundecaprenol N-acetyl-beta-D-mannosaminyltransferase